MPKIAGTGTSTNFAAVCAVIAGLGGLLAVLVFSSYRRPHPNGELNCQDGLAYDGQTYDFSAGSKLIHLDLKTSPSVGRQLSDQLQVYLIEAASLCRLYTARQLTSAEYIAHRDWLYEQFGRFVPVARNASALGADDLPVLKETLAALRPTSQRSATSFTFRVRSEGREVQNGESLDSGKHFRIEIELRQPSWLYVVLKDSRGQFFRMYPSTALGSANPVSGRINIPDSPYHDFKLDDVTGVEQIMVFVNDHASDVIEDQLSDLTSESPPMEGLPANTDRKAEAWRTLNRAMEIRGIVLSTGHADVGAASTSDATRSPATAVTSEVGQAAYRFLIDHRA